MTLTVLTKIRLPGAGQRAAALLPDVRSERAARTITATLPDCVMQHYTCTYVMYGQLSTRRENIIFLMNFPYSLLNIHQNILTNDIICITEQYG